MGRGPAARVTAVVAALVLAGGAAGCTLVEEDADEGPRSPLAGRIDLDGSSTLEPFTALAAERFQDEHPRVAVVVSISPSRTSGGFDRFCTGETDLSSASRRIEADEIRASGRRGSSTSNSRWRSTPSPSS